MSDTKPSSGSSGPPTKAGSTKTEKENSSSKQWRKNAPATRKLEALAYPWNEEQSFARKCKTWFESLRIAHPASQEKEASKLLGVRCFHGEGKKNCPPSTNLHWRGAAARELATAKCVTKVVLEGFTHIQFAYGSTREANVARMFRKYLESQFTFTRNGTIVAPLTWRLTGAHWDAQDARKRSATPLVQSECTVLIDVYRLGRKLFTPHNALNLFGGVVFSVGMTFHGPCDTTLEGSWYRNEGGKTVTYMADELSYSHNAHDPCDWRNCAGDDGVAAWDDLYSLTFPRRAKDGNYVAQKLVRISRSAGVPLQECSSNLRSPFNTYGVPVDVEDLGDEVRQFVASQIDPGLSAIAGRPTRSVVFKDSHLTTLRNRFSANSPTANTFSGVQKACHALASQDPDILALQRLNGCPIGDGYAEDLQVYYLANHMRNLLKASSQFAQLGPDAAQHRSNLLNGAKDHTWLSRCNRLVRVFINSVCSWFVRLGARTGVWAGAASLYERVVAFVDSQFSKGFARLSDLVGPLVAWLLDFLAPGDDETPETPEVDAQMDAVESAATMEPFFDSTETEETTTPNSTDEGVATISDSIFSLGETSGLSDSVVLDVPPPPEDIETGSPLPNPVNDDQVSNSSVPTERFFLEGAASPQIVSHNQANFRYQTERTLTLVDGSWKLDWINHLGFDDEKSLGVHASDYFEEGDPRVLARVVRGDVEWVIVRQDLELHKLYLGSLHGDHPWKILTDQAVKPTLLSQLKCVTVPSINDAGLDAFANASLQAKQDVLSARIALRDSAMVSRRTFAQAGAHATGVQLLRSAKGTNVLSDRIRTDGTNAYQILQAYAAAVGGVPPACTLSYEGLEHQGTWSALVEYNGCQARSDGQLSRKLARREGHEFLCMYLDQENFEMSEEASNERVRRRFVDEICGHAVPSSAFEPTDAPRVCDMSLAAILDVDVDQFVPSPSQAPTVPIVKSDDAELRLDGAIADYREGVHCGLHKTFLQNEPDFRAHDLSGWVLSEKTKVKIKVGGEHIEINPGNAEMIRKSLVVGGDCQTVTYYLHMGVEGWVPASRKNMRSLMDTVLLKEAVQVPYPVEVQEFGYKQQPMTDAVEFLCAQASQSRTDEEAMAFVDEHLRTCKNKKLMQHARDSLGGVTLCNKHNLHGGAGKSFCKSNELLLKYEPAPDHEEYVEFTARQVNASSHETLTLKHLCAVYEPYHRMADFVFTRVNFDGGMSTFIGCCGGVSEKLSDTMTAWLLTAKRTDRLYLVSGDDGWAISYLTSGDYRVIMLDITKCDKSTRGPALSAQEEVMAAWGVDSDAIASLVNATKANLKFSSWDGLIEFLVTRFGFRVLGTGDATTTWRNTITGLLHAVGHSDSCPFVGIAYKNLYARNGYAAKVHQHEWDPLSDEPVLPGDFLKSYWYILGNFAEKNFVCVFTPLPSRVIKIFKSLTPPDSTNGVNTLKFLSNVRCMLNSFPKDVFMQRIASGLPTAESASLAGEQIHSMMYGFACGDQDRALQLGQVSESDWLRFAIRRYGTTEDEILDFWNHRPSVEDDVSSVWAHPLIRKMARVDYAYLAHEVAPFYDLDGGS